MKSIIPVIIVLLVMSNASSETHHVRFCGKDRTDRNFNYLIVQLGDTIEWKGFFGTYPLRSLIVPEGAQSWLVRSGFVFRYVVKVPGRYYYECEFGGERSIVGGVVAGQPEMTKLGSN